MSDSEDYDSACGGPIILTKEDIDKLDALSSSSYPTTPDTMSTSVLRTVSNAIKSTSPFQRFRPNGRLSVTDLVSPTWSVLPVSCEVQFEYGLHQQRSRKLECRPPVFTTRHGKEIKVEQHTAVVNDATLKGGHAVHITLEREIHPDRVKIEVQSEEELWARKFLDMLACIQTLALSGICREFPVVGFVHGQLVAGIIDEIKRAPYTKADPTADIATDSPPSSPPRSQPNHTDQKRSRGRPRKSSGSQPYNQTSNVSDNSNPPKLHQKQQHCLFISDSKTRFSRSLPPHSGTLASRLQLMLYRNLLNDLVSLTTPFDFDRLWQSLRLDPMRTFSASFLAQILPLLGHDSNVACLRDLEQKWKINLAQLDLLDIGGATTLPVHEQLTVVYRLRDYGKSNQLSKRKKSRPSSSSSEDEQLQKAILESIQPAVTEQTAPCETTRSPNGKGSNLNPVVNNTKILENTDIGNVKPNGESVEGGQGTTVAGDIIGQIQFNHDNTLLDSNIDHILNWWYGKREPIGVSIEEANRCKVHGRNKVMDG
ncbi:hypothetical protein Clacol_007425 [Clathrus columnatus]|uniref:Uncharacterized protein n=1 Tax=Clathrus columnatus TaxID=1419009 RepID=A0AAV5AJ67_9AGAM|nr:hypothetical protein Clacol_007425 [Clathrus columnatus]